ncbi:hypothetical protein ROA7745_03663 [Roseovarius aestuarii]|uniref:Uncharacterized protein n=1 Tax=Roseovarius aestuarii TaxID=475083 RepID=A0A1X7BW11_9RHOB|nr:hypothetical protein ROA7745_03663 [Roseovarius aestuarii]
MLTNLPEVVVAGDSSFATTSKGMLNMTSYKSFAMLLNDIEKFSEDQQITEAGSLIKNAREALRKDLRDQVEKRRSSRKSDISTGAQQHS